MCCNKLASVLTCGRRCSVLPGHSRCWAGVVLALGLAMVLAGCSKSSGTPAPLINATVSGTVSYEDKVYDAQGFTGNTVYKTLRYAVVDLVDNTGNIVDSSATDADGHYLVQGQGRGLYVRVLSLTTADAGSSIAITTYSGDAYAITQTLATDSDGAVALDFPISLNNRIAGVFNMLDVYTNASLFVSTLTTSPLPDMKVVWQSAASNYGTYFCPANSSGGMCPQGKGIYVLGGTSDGGDTDEYDDDVLLHEYGHYVESTLGIRDSPGGTHYLTENDQDIRLAWSEGWGGFFPDAVKSWLKANDPARLSSVDSLPASYYVDTYGSFASLSIDMAAPLSWMCSSSNDCFDYSTSEVAVAKLLDGLNQAFGMQAIWDVVSGYMATGTSMPASLETLWDGWLQQRAPGSLELQQLQGIFAERKVNYSEDNTESDNSLAHAHLLSVCTSTPCAAEQHTLYRTDKVDDVDLFTAQLTKGNTYTIETLGLSNGADTFISLLDSNGNLVYDSSGTALRNDNRPGTTFCYPYDNPCRVHYDDTMLSSVLQFTPTVSGDYYVEVKTSPYHPAGAGRYGSYAIQVQRQ